MAYKSKTKQRQYQKMWENNNPMRTRASYLVKNYNRSDKKYKRGHGDLTTQWIIDNIFTKKCAHCNKSGWQIIGCNRLDNSRPHTKDNVEPCCEECNHKLNGIYIQSKCGSKVKKIDPNSNEVLEVYNSLREAAKLNNGAHIAIKKCCDGGFFDKKRGKWMNCYIAYGYKWQYAT